MNLLSKFSISLLACASLSNVITGTSVFAATSTPQNNHISQINSHQTKQSVIPIISNIKMVHYNVVRAELQTPIKASDNFLDLVYGQDRHSLIGAEPAYDDDGNYIGFDINLDEIARNHMNTQDVVDSLAFKSVDLHNGAGLYVKVNTQPLKDLILTAVDQGDIIRFGSVDMNTVAPLQAYSQYLSNHIAADHILNGKLTTLSGGMEIPIKPGYETGYTYKVVGRDGTEIQNVFTSDNKLFITPEFGFSNQQYTLSVQKDGETSSSDLMYFTPYAIF